MSTLTTTITPQAGSSIALDALGSRPNAAESLTNTVTPAGRRGRFTTTTETDNDDHPPQDDGPPPPPATPLNNKNNNNTLFKLISTGFSFFVAGVNDGSLGALIPYVIRSYGITTALVSALYAATLAGWLAAALTSTHLAQRLRLGYLLGLGALLQTAAHALRCWPPAGAPFGLFVASFFLVSLGQAYQDTFGNTFVASLSRGEKKKKEGDSVHRWLGFIHAMYMAGCLVAPFGATSIAATGTVGTEGVGSRWWLFYTVPLSLGVVNFGLVLVAFRDMLGFVGRTRSRMQMADASEPEGKKSASRLMKEALNKRSVWLLSLFFFFYLGVVVTAGGWVVEYLVDVRNGDIAQMGYVPAGFSGGGLLGRILLPEPTHRWGEKKMVSLYCVLCLGFQLLFWLVPNIIAASVAISLLGFFSGPLFATAISVGTRLFPADINATAISFVFVFAQIGGSVFPMVTGVLAAHTGVSAMQPVLVGLIVAMTISWLLVPQPKGKTK
ncbi:bypass of stop codon protein 6 [Chaetomidium leptoderma]|uniref:Bypass of stop codon protein 6 n=1 Tax=Chaetomidium leptoderma TaxID=669021 RepID=A0AAN6VK35_9PEZI|nr:bypass of stop codon protein 6 [Chaetomidium leptoderma]